MIKHRNDKLSTQDEVNLGFKIQDMKAIKDREDYNYSQLSKEEQMTVDEGDKALEILTGNYINFARNIAHKHHKRTGTRYNIDDLLQDAISALVEAAQKYDPSKNFKLGTYAYHGIAKKVSTTINYQRLVRMPENKMGEYISITKAQKEYSELSDEEKEKYSSELDYVYKNVGNLKKKEVDLILENMQPQVSLNSHIYDGEGELMDLIVDDNSEIEIKSLDALDKNVVKIINQLNDFQKNLVAYEFGVFPPSMPYEDFLEKYDVTDKKVKRETKKTITLMSNIAKKDNLSVDMS